MNKQRVCATKTDNGSDVVAREFPGQPTERPRCALAQFYQYIDRVLASFVVVSPGVARP